jgi:hypothetical protein
LQYAFIEFENQKDCEQAYFKMQGVLIDDHRIHVDFSQSVRWLISSRSIDATNLWGRSRSSLKAGGRRPYLNVKVVDLVVYPAWKESASTAQQTTLASKTATEWYLTGRRCAGDLRSTSHYNENHVAGAHGEATHTAVDLKKGAITIDGMIVQIRIMTREVTRGDGVDVGWAAHTSCHIYVSVELVTDMNGNCRLV